MSMDEVEYIVESCKKRKIKFNVIELTGGEASLWNNLLPGMELLKQICNEITMVTNGNNPELVLSLNMKSFIVSSSQASAKQLEIYRASKRKILYNAHSHKELPVSPVSDSLPAKCCVKYSAVGILQTAMEYIRGKVYFCCDAYAHSERVVLTPDVVCDFEDDFISKFSVRDYNKDICTYCLCNSKVWDTI